MNTRVLVFPCGSEIGLEIHRALAWSTHITFFGASSESSNHGKYVFDNYIEGVPFVDNPEFISKINDVVDTYKIDFIFPAHDSVVVKLAENNKSLNCKYVGSPVLTCQICRSKLKTYQLFNSILKVPRIYKEVNDELTFPLFLKPDVGQGSKGTYLVNSKYEVDFYVKKDPTLLVLEYLPGIEYTVDCFSDRYGVLRFVGAS